MFRGMNRKPIRKPPGKDAKVTGLLCPHCKGDHFKAIADLTVGGVPYVYITEDTVAIGFECWTCGEQYLIKRWGE